MISKLSVSAAALAAMGLAAPAMAQTNLWYMDDAPNYGAQFHDGNPTLGGGATVNIEVAVENIAVLWTVNDTGTMILDDGNDPFMGVSSVGSQFDQDGTLAELQFDTNFDISSVEISFPTVRGGNAAGRIRGFTNQTYFGRATNTDGSAASQTLGVWPQAGVLTGPGGNLGGTGNTMAGNPGDGGPIVRTNLGGGAFGNGTHHISLGVSTNWTRTANGEPDFAEPGDYVIPLTATLVP